MEVFSTLKGEKTKQKSTKKSEKQQQDYPNSSKMRQKQQHGSECKHGS